MAFSDFYKWYQSRERKCTYCEITEAEIKELIDTGRLTTKRLTTRGRKLELERKQSELEYDNFENLAFACYWCNNAKTDTFSEEEFLKVGSVFKEIWKQRLG
jgi:5-methylcytosine-specific restriction endonuclease McrA